ncbi:MAG: redoxin family protein [Candidatus Obscuribacterales bacterium]|nr:redoxin family protein [Candidatus Obscuribacterales bacterium]
MRTRRTGCLQGALGDLLIALAVVIPLSACILANAVAQTLPNESLSKAKKSAVTYAEDIAPILYNRCASCHHAGEVAPFPLMSFEDAKKRADTINAVVQAGYMPPWKPAHGFGEFKASRALSEREIQSIKQWVENGAPSGDLAKAPEPPKFSSDWRLGPPDLILTMDQTFQVPADGPDIYRCFVIPTGLLKNKYVSAVEFKPGNRKVVHHALFFLDNTGVAKKKDSQDKTPGFQSFGGPGFIPTGGLGGWAPGNSQQPLPEGIARIIRAGADLVIQEHFHPTGKPEQEKSTIGIYFSKTTPKRLLLPVVVRSRGIDIPANESHHEVKASFELPIDMQLVNVTPHAHLLAKQIKAVATQPDGKKIPLIQIKSWDFNWQEQYTFLNPIKLPRGSRIEAEFVYDNTQGNPRNPNSPPKRVYWGEQTTDEMAILFFGAIAERQEDVPAYIRTMLVKNAPLILKGNPGQLFKAARQLLRPDARFGKILPEDDTPSLKPQEGAAQSNEAALTGMAQQTAPEQIARTAIQAAEQAPNTVRRTSRKDSDKSMDNKTNRAKSKVSPSGSSAGKGKEGQAAAPIAMTDATTSKPLSIPEPDKTATVLLFLGTDCPISNRYSPDIIRISKTYATKGVEFVGVYCDPELEAKDISAHGAKFGYNFNLVHDKSKTLKDRCGIKRTPEVAVLDSRGELVYRGRIDDRYVTFGTMRPSAKTHDLTDVLDALAAHKPVKPRFTDAVGCSMPN